MEKNPVCMKLSNHGESGGTGENRGNGIMEINSMLEEKSVRILCPQYVDRSYDQ